MKKKGLYIAGAAVLLGCMIAYFSPLFSDGSITDPDDRTLTVFIYDDRSSVASIVMASSGKIAVNDKSYRFENAGELIGQIIALMEQAG